MCALSVVNTFPSLCVDLQTLIPSLLSLLCVRAGAATAQGVPAGRGDATSGSQRREQGQAGGTATPLAGAAVGLAGSHCLEEKIETVLAAPRGPAPLRVGSRRQRRREQEHPQRFGPWNGTQSSAAGSNIFPLSLQQGCCFAILATLTETFGTGAEPWTDGN